MSDYTVELTANEKLLQGDLFGALAENRILRDQIYSSHQTIVDCNLTVTSLEKKVEELERRAVHVCMDGGCDWRMPT